MADAYDKVSIASNVYEQKRLVLCMLKELYKSFKERYPGFKVGFFTFATLRPKWCVLAGSAGAHVVCISMHNSLKCHSNVKVSLNRRNLSRFNSMMVCDINNKD